VVIVEVVIVTVVVVVVIVVVAVDVVIVVMVDELAIDHMYKGEEISVNQPQSHVICLVGKE